MSRLTRDGAAEPVSRDQILRHARGQGNIHFPCPADHVQDWQPYPVDPYSAICDDHTYILYRSPELLVKMYCIYRLMVFPGFVFVSLHGDLCKCTVVPVAQRYLVTLWHVGT